MLLNNGKIYFVWHAGCKGKGYFGAEQVKKCAFVCNCQLFYVSLSYNYVRENYSLALLTKRENIEIH